MEWPEVSAVVTAVWESIPQHFPGTTSDVYSEEAARGFYRYWSQLMSRNRADDGD